ncbi:MAG: putative NAD(P)H nitroreductase YdjA [Anaerolineales bacterium]|nr:putative NAD(P)H nitroreductase YdjA [Anaerolineales bacterium]
MDALLAIQTRHSVKKVKTDRVPRETIEKLLAAGNDAPNHHKVRPWRFFVMTGEARARLGDVMAASQRERLPDLPPAGFDKTRALPQRAPLIIAVGVDRPSDERISEIENVCAAAAACQNILLAAHALGLGATWRTGEWADDKMVKEFFGLAPDQHLISFLYIGYAEGGTMFPQRPAVDDRVTWME